MIALFVLCVFSLRKPKLNRSNQTKHFHSPKSRPLYWSQECATYFTEAQADAYVADCGPGGACTWGREQCPPVSYKDYDDLDDHEKCITWVCDDICYDEECNPKDWCYPGQPNDNWKEDDWKTYFERGDEGDCAADDKTSDEEITSIVENRKIQEDACEKWYGNSCK
jgi:hypothetical protein